MRNLLKNERMKLYKKVSTWVLTGVVVGLSVLMLLIQGGSELWMTRMNSSEDYSWQDSYAQSILEYHNQLKENPKDKSAQNEKEKYEYLLNNNINPESWKSDVVLTYYELVGSRIAIEQQLTEKGETDFSKDAEWRQYDETASSYQRLMGASDWKDYVRLQIKEVENGHTEFETPEEKQVQIDILNMYLEYNVEPVSSGRVTIPGSGYYYAWPPSVEKSWQQKELESLKLNKLALLRNEYTSDYGESSLLTDSDRQKLEDEVTLSIERLKSGIALVDSLSLYGLMETSLTSFSLLSILLIVLAGGIISSEFSNGTIKLLLISPHRRRSIFWSKALILLEITLIATGATFVLSFLLSGILGGFGGIGALYMSTLFGSIVKLPYILVILYKYLLFLLPVLAFGALALMLSAVTRKTAVATAVSILLLYGGNIFSSLAAMLSNYFVIPGAKFLLFTNTSLSPYFTSPSGMFTDIGTVAGISPGLVDHSMTLIFSVVILLLYTVCFLWIARDSFCRRDVK